MNRNLLYIFCLVIALHSGKVSAQVAEVTKSVKVLTQVWEKYYSTLDTTNVFISPVKAFGLISSPNTNSISEEELKLNIKEAEAENFRHDPGLNVGANYLENFTPAINDDDDNLIYNRRIQAGVTWDILNGGLMENRMLEKKIRNEIYLNKQSETQGSDKKQYADNWNRIIYLFNSEKIKWLDERRQVLSSLESEAEKLYFLKFLQREKYLDILSRKTENESMYRIYADYNRAFEKMQDSILKQVEVFPVFDVNYDTIIHHLNGNHVKNDSAFLLFEENLKMEQSLIHDISLSTSLRYNYYNLVTDNPNSRTFFTFGINFAMPLPFNYKQKKALALARSEYAQYIYEHQDEEYSREVLNDCYEYRYKLKQLEGFYQKRNLMEEKLRKYNALKDIDPLRFNPVEALNTYDEYLAVQIEITDLKQNLYLKFLRINSYFSDSFQQELTASYDLPVNFELDDAVTRSVYAWSETLERNTAFFIREYALYNKIDRLIISVKSDTAYIRKFNLVAELLMERQIETEAMIGDNNLILAADYLAAIDQKMKSVDVKNIMALHLDVEPHTFADWDTRKAEYLTKYANMLQKARIWCDGQGVQLHVSIPLHYPEETVKEVIAICDRVYFMAYENIKTDYIKRKVEPFLANSEKLVLASSVKDFENRTGLEQQLMDLFKATSVSQMAIHDLGKLIMLDEQNIEDKE